MACPDLPDTVQTPSSLRLSLRVQVSNSTGIETRAVWRIQVGEALWRPRDRWRTAPGESVQDSEGSSHHTEGIMGSGFPRAQFTGQGAVVYSRLWVLSLTMSVHNVIQNQLN